MRKRRLLFSLVLGLMIVCLTAVVVSAFSNVGLSNRAPVADRLSEQDKAYLVEADHLRRTLGHAVWPGWDQVEIPNIVYNQDYAFVVGFPDPPAGWFKVPDGPRRGGAWQPVESDLFQGETYYWQKLPGGQITPEAFTVKVGDRWLASLPARDWLRTSLQNQIADQLPPLVNRIVPYRVIVPLFTGNADKYVTMILHESFHTYQGMQAPERLAAAERAMQTTGGYPWEKQGIRAYWQRETDLLAQALEARDADETRALARQFLAQRYDRRQQFDLQADIVDYERQREWLEGCAKFVELDVWKVAFIAPSYQPVEAIRSLPDFDDYRTFERVWSQEVAQLKRAAAQESDSLFYYTGMAQAFLLERMYPGWQTRIMEEGIYLEDLLQAVIGDRAAFASSQPVLE
jgi:hypothetical protein